MHWFTADSNRPPLSAAPRVRETFRSVWAFVNAQGTREQQLLIARPGLTWRERLDRPRRACSDPGSARPHPASSRSGRATLGAACSRILFGSSAADSTLWEAARRLAVDDMRTALEAGAAAANDSEYFDVAEWVLLAPGAKGMGLPERIALQCAALRLFAQYGLTTKAASEALQRATSPAVVRILLDAGADPNASRDDRVLLHRVGSRNAEIARMLIAAGADVNTSAFNQCRPLHFAVEFHAGEERQRVAGADVNAQDSYGRTCLFDAVIPRLGQRWPRPALVRLLLEGGADPTIASRAGDTPLAFALGCCSTNADSVARRQLPPDVVVLMKSTARQLLRATAWRRRKHLLLAVRGRHAAAAGETRAATSTRTAAGAAHSGWRCGFVPALWLWL